MRTLWIGLVMTAACAHSSPELLTPYTPLPDAVTEGGRRPVQTLADTRSATLTVRSRGARACQVFLDEELLGTAPIANRKVGIGRREVRLTCLSGGTYASTVVLHNGRSAELTIRVPATKPIASLETRDMRGYVGEAVAL